jgi:hypothetical protein
MEGATRRRRLRNEVKQSRQRQSNNRSCRTTGGSQLPNAEYADLLAAASQARTAQEIR